MSNINKIKEALGLSNMRCVKQPIRFISDPTKLYYCYGFSLPLKAETVIKKGLEDKIRCIIDRKEYRDEYREMKFKEQQENYKWFLKKKEQEQLPF